MSIVGQQDNTMSNGMERHVHWNDLLPYKVEAGHDSLQVLLQEIKRNVDIVDLVALACCASRLEQMLDLKLKFENEEWVELIDICYNLVIDPPANHVTTRQAYANVLIRIFHISTIKHKHIEIVIPWRPLWDLVQEYLYKPARESKLYSDEGCIKSVVRFAGLARKYFDQTEVNDLHQLINSSNYPLLTGCLMQHAAMLVAFLPTECYTVSLVEDLNPMNGLLWGSASRRIDALNMTLISRLVKSSISPNWEEWCPFILSILRRHLRLPGPEPGPKSMSKYNAEEKAGNRIVRSIHGDFVKPFSKWIVRVISDSNVILEHLAQFLTALDSFFHPSNGGSWSSELSHLLNCLVEAMNKRQSASHRVVEPLNSDIAEKFVKCLWPAVSKLIFSKNVIIALNAQDIIKGLASLCPNFVLPEVLLIADSSLSSLTEPHRTTAAIGVLGTLSRSLVKEDQLPALLALLPLTLPGIDSNDPMKTVATLSLITGSLMTFRLDDNVISYIDSESFVILFLEQCFTFLRNMTKTASEGSDNGVQAMLINSWDVFFCQLDANLHRLALSRILSFIKNESHPHAIGVMGFLLGKAFVFGSVDLYPGYDKEYQSTLHWLLGDIMTSLSKGAGQDETQSDESCSRLLLLLHASRRVIQFGRGSLFQFSEKFCQLFDLSVNCRQKTVAILTSKLFRALIKVLSSTSPIEWSSDQNDGNSTGLFRLHDIKVHWKQPTIDDLDFALSIVSYMTSNIDKIDYLRTKLLFLRSIIKGLASIKLNFDQFSSSAIGTIDQKENLLSLLDAVRLKMFELQRKLDTVEVKKMFIDLVGVALTYSGIGRSMYSGLAQMVKYMKSSLSAFKKDHMRPRYWFIKRAFLQHLCRIEKLSYPTVEDAEWPIVEPMLDSIFTFSLDKFSELQREAQGVLGSIAYLSPIRTRYIADSWLDSVSHAKLDEAFDEDALKAVLSVRGSVLVSSICSDWKLLEKFVSWIVPLNERQDLATIPRIYDMITSMFVETAKSFTTPPDPSSKNMIFDNERDESRQRIFKLLTQYSDNGSWRAKVMSLTFILIFMTEHDRIDEDIVRVYLEGCASDIHNVRFSALQGVKIALHLWRMQQLSDSKPVQVLQETIVNWQTGTHSSITLDPIQPYLLNISSDVISKSYHQSVLEEADDPSKLDFRSEIARLVQSITDVLGSSPIVILLREELTVEGVTWSVGKQRVFAEWIGGLLRSCLLTGVDLEDIFELIKQCWVRSAVDSARYWNATFSFACRNRVCHNIFQFLSDSLLRCTTCTTNELMIAIMSMNGFIKSTGWLYDFSPISKLLIPVLENPSPLVRREVALLFREISRSTFSSLTKRPECLPPIEVLAQHPKVLLELAHSLLADPVLSGAWIQIDEILPPLLQFHHSDDIDMQLASKAASKRLAWIEFCPSIESLLKTLDVIDRVASDPECSVHVKKLAIATLGSFFNRNFILFSANKKNALKYLYLLQKYCMDEHVDIREAASSCLTAFFHANPNIAAEQSAKLLKDLQLGLSDVKCTAGVSKRHGMVLQACSLILSQPYHLSSWAPPILLLLTKFIPDRAPVTTTVRKGFSEFKRTHMDNWAAERLLFSEDELDAISELLVSPSYYA